MIKYIFIEYYSLGRARVESEANPGREKVVVEWETVVEVEVQRMFCPGCGTEDRQRSQFCRTCGTDLRVARTGLERPGSVIESAVNAREEIGRSVALKLREVQSGKDLQHIAERVLPQITEFLKTPEEARLSRIREGMISTSVGISLTIFFVIVSIISNDKGPLIAAAIGLVPFLAGISIVLNGLYFSLPTNRDIKLLDEDSDPDQLFDRRSWNSVEPAVTPQSNNISSVTEHTTHHLSET